MSLAAIMRSDPRVGPVCADVQSEFRAALRGVGSEVHEQPSFMCRRNDWNTCADYHSRKSGKGMAMRNGDAKSYGRSSSQGLPTVLIVVTLGATSSVSGAPQTYRVDPAKSRTTIHVGKAGAFSFVAGHSHVVTGPIESGSIDVDADAPSQARIQLVIASAGLKVSPEGEPAGDAPKVQDAMESDAVLDVAHHPRITFESASVTVRSRQDNALELAVAGRLTIRGTGQTVTAPVRVRLTDDALSAIGKMTIKQTAFGIKPVSVGGVVAVKDELEIEFSISAAR